MTAAAPATIDDAVAAVAGRQVTRPAAAAGAGYLAVLAALVAAVVDGYAMATTEGSKR